MGNVTKFYCKDAAMNPDAVFEQAVGQYSDALILGRNKDGDFDPRASLGMDKKEMLLVIETFKANLINGIYDE